MKHLLLLFTCLITFSIASAQCDYNTLVKEGRTLYERQQYRAALKKFNAARTCDPSKSADVDKEVDKVFDAIEGQRDEAKTQRDEAKLQKARVEEEKGRVEEARELAEKEKNRAIEAIKVANSLRDSTNEAIEQRLIVEQQKFVLMQANDRQELGDYYLAKRDFTTAIQNYSEGLLILDQFPQKDTSFQKDKHETLETKIVIAEEWLKRYDCFNYQINQGDSLMHIGVDGFFESYHHYFNALECRYDTASVIQKLSSLDFLLQSNPAITQNVKGSAYYKLMTRSAEANLFTGNSTVADKRLKSMFRHRPEYFEPTNYTYINNSISKYRRNKNLLSMLEPFAGTKWDFYPNITTPSVKIDYEGVQYKSANNVNLNINTYWLEFLGLSLKISKRIRLNFELSDRANFDAHDNYQKDVFNTPSGRFYINYYNTAFDITTANLYASVNILKFKNIWRHSIFNIQVLGGLSFQSFYQPSVWTFNRDVSTIKSPIPTSLKAYFDNVFIMPYFSDGFHYDDSSNPGNLTTWDIALVPHNPTVSSSNFNEFLLGKNFRYSNSSYSYDYTRLFYLLGINLKFAPISKFPPLYISCGFMYMFRKKSDIEIHSFVLSDELSYVKNTYTHYGYALGEDIDQYYQETANIRFTFDQFNDPPSIFSLRIGLGLSF